MTDILHGYIIEKSAGRGDSVQQENIRKHNWSVIEELPSENRWPPLHSKMFYAVPSAHLLQYKDPLILVGGSFKQIVDDWDDWLKMFESMIQKMYWEEIVISLESELVGPRQFRWKPKSEWFIGMTNEGLQPVTEWDFTGVRKFFDGINRIE